jgi:ParB family chromosome partitioning protein
VDREAKHSSKSNEWYTPAEYIEAAREVLGSIELDPASCEQANRIVKAERFYSMEDDGLIQPWEAKTVFLNPPYGKTAGRSNQEIWSRKLLDVHRCGRVGSAILLVNAEPGNKWFRPLWEYPLCFTDHRIRFYTDDGERNAPTHSNCFVYLPPRDGADRWMHLDRFADAFMEFGAIINPGGVMLKPPF